MNDVQLSELKALPKASNETGTLWPGQYFSIFKMPDGRAPRGRRFPHRVWCADISEHIYRHISLSTISFFTKPLLFINSLILVKIKNFSF